MKEQRTRLVAPVSLQPGNGEMHHCLGLLSRETELEELCGI
jgi:hypothetical protein